VEKMDVHSNQVAADDQVPAQVDTQPIVKILSIGNINYNINHQLLNSGHLSQLFAVTFGERVRDVYQSGMPYKCALLQQNHL
jgi:hypothetical protein